MIKTSFIHGPFKARLPQQATVALGLSLALLTTLSGCAFAPGSYMGVPPSQGTSAQTGGEPQVTELVQDGITFRLHPVSSDLIAHLSSRPGAAEQALPRLPLSVPSAYRVRNGDTLRVIVWDRPELNNPGFSALTTSIVSIGGADSAAVPSATAGGNLDPVGRVVQPDGSIYFPYVGKVKVAGQTTDAIRIDLTNRLNKFVKDPQLDVTISSYRSQKVYVSGAVKAPGSLAVTDTPETVADAISGAGGYSAGADLAAATLNRGGQVFPLDLYAFFYNGDLSQNVLLKDGDVINVPERRLKKVFVLGEVAKPVSQVMPVGPLSLSEAIADAGGLNPLSANASQVYVFRKGPDRTVDVFQLDAASPGMLVLADQFPLQPRDVVFVDAAHVTRFYRVVSQVLPFASSFYLGAQAFK
ncbi:MULTISPECIES: polysaccharide biosynthesis/export family protein [Paraburkholderia]|uniref:polysaccharide biosynthesis/export family protein n=1 Tax=Paraburkholderia TaxID=1822464 RepID=UPI002256A33B|nr:MULTISPECIES: polysaccharide biosynthesis/export family protein [Paraburkholderia]MCX4175808.1 polysaccharide biosynthesis/export family protein [Paraburkholderia madseniana]MDQ6463802.1 polysaccharide biosynthesis/export family protein [Paraburkholderia madseniana]